MRGDGGNRWRGSRRSALKRLEGVVFHGKFTLSGFGAVDDRFLFLEGSGAYRLFFSSGLECGECGQVACRKFRCGSLINMHC